MLISFRPFQFSLYSGFEVIAASYQMIVNNTRYVRGCGHPLSFTTNVPATEGILAVVLSRANGTASMNIPLNLIGLSVNGYGQIVVTLPPAVMNPLDSANYVLTVQFENGMAQAPFRILLPSVFPMTGDEAPTVMLICVMFAALGTAAVTMLILRRNKRRHANGRHSR